MWISCWHNFFPGLGYLVWESQRISENGLVVEVWHVHQQMKELQSFLVFANYHIFNLGLQYGCLTSHSSSNMLIGWSQEAHEVLEHLYRCVGFSPDQPQHAVHSWRGCFWCWCQGVITVHWLWNLFLPVLFSSHYLSPTEQNFHVGNHELLAVKLTLEDWRHWLEGTEQPFLVWMDYKNQPGISMPDHILAPWQVIAQLPDGIEKAIQEAQQD